MRPLLLLVALAALSTADEGETLSLRLVIPDSTICAGTQRVPVELQLRNKSGKPVTINLRGFGGGFDAMALYDTESNSARLESLQLVGDPIRLSAPAQRSIPPGATHISPASLELDQEFFAKPGFYKIRAEYSDRSGDPKVPNRHMVSNWVIVQIEFCSENVGIDRKNKP
jgi:hypothetical protein